MGRAGPGRDGLGLPVTQEQVDELEAHITDIDYEKAPSGNGSCAMT